MITFSKLGKHGNLGNQLFQIASLIGLGKTFHQQTCIPEWQYKEHFEGLPPIKNIEGEKVEEINYHYDLQQFDKLNNEANYDLLGWLQSEKYWNDAIIFRLKDNEKHEAPTIGLSIRRGDYVDNPNYVLLQVNYYLNALLKFNLTHYNILVFSDDIEYCKIHFRCLHNVTFASGNAIEQLTQMAKCHAFVIANSTFSWWGAYLGKGTTIRPNCLFDGNLLNTSDYKDFYPDNWLIQDYQEKIDIRDTTFIIPVKYDHPHREENILLNIMHLQKYFDTNIIVGEVGNKFNWMSKHVNYVEFKTEKFHRTKMLNEMTLLAETPYVFNWDADVFISPVQIWQAVDMLRSGTDFVYPYNGKFARVPRSEASNLGKYLDVGMLKGNYIGTRKTDMDSVGGAIGYIKKSFIDAGGENEKFISYGAEDLERKYRFEKLGYEVERVEGFLYHLDHFISLDSSTKHENFNANQAEYEKVVKMGKAELTEYIKSWELKTDKKLNNNLLTPLKVKHTMTLKLNPKFIGGLAVVGHHNIKLTNEITQAELEILYDKQPHLVIAEVTIEKKSQDHSQELNTPTISTLTEQPKGENNLSEALPKQELNQKGKKQKTVKN